MCALVCADPEAEDSVTAMQDTMPTVPLLN